ncbi:MAG: DUF374 domain-containing protein [Candidatus Latescibacteria bacterium]|nr:DUF374 domain-containing protein [Candidatus Latescibacterota bacterium]
MSAGASQFLKLALARPAWRLLATTVRRVPAAGTTRRGAVIFASLHRDMIPAALHVLPARASLLVSQSRDGDILIRTLAPDGFGFVRGSTGKDGADALRSLLEVLRRDGAVGLAVDGPRGPFGTVHEGAVLLARLSGAPVVPLRARPGRHLSLRTWDRTIVPLPWATVAIEEGADVSVPREADTASCAAVAAELGAWLRGERSGA